MGLLGVSTSDEQGQKSCNSVPRSSLAEHRGLCSAIGTMLVVGDFPPSSQAWPVLEGPFGSLASRQGCHWTGSVQEKMLKPFCGDTVSLMSQSLDPGGRHPGLNEEAWHVQRLGQWVKGGASVSGVFSSWLLFPSEVITLHHNYSRSLVSCTSFRLAGTINSAQPQQTDTHTKCIKKMNCFSPLFHVLLLITDIYNLGKCLYKASEQPGTHEGGKTTVSCK